MTDFLSRRRLVKRVRVRVRVSVSVRVKVRVRIRSRARVRVRVRVRVRQGSIRSTRCDTPCPHRGGKYRQMAVCVR